MSRNLQSLNEMRDRINDFFNKEEMTERQIRSIVHQLFNNRLDVRLLVTQFRKKALNEMRNMVLNNNLFIKYIFYVDFAVYFILFV